MNTLYVVNETYTGNYTSDILLPDELYVDNTFIYIIAAISILTILVIGTLGMNGINSSLNPFRDKPVLRGKSDLNLRGKAIRDREKNDIPVVDLCYVTLPGVNGRPTKLVFDKNQVSGARLRQLYPQSSTRLNL